MPNFCIKFFNMLLSSDGHPFKVLQRVVNVRHSKTAEDAAQKAQGEFQRLEHVPDWKLHADCCEVQVENESAGGEEQTMAIRLSAHRARLTRTCEVQIPPIGLVGALHIPEGAHSLVAFAHGSGSSRLSPRNIAVANAMNSHGIATLLFDLLARTEEADGANVFDIPLLANRLVDAIDWLHEDPLTAWLPLGLFGASTGAAAALVAAARRPHRVGAVVSRGGRPDLAGSVLDLVQAPTLLIVGGLDFGVLELNKEALDQLECHKALEIVPGATHLFPEQGALDTVIDLAVAWFQTNLVPSSSKSIAGG